MRGTNDKAGLTVGANDPKFVNYLITNANTNSTFDENWDFHLQAGSPALTGAKTDVVRNFPNGLTLKGVAYIAPAASAFFGAYGTK